MSDNMKPEYALIKCVRAALHDETISLPIDTDIVTLAKRHQVQTLLYMATQAKHLQKQFNVAIAQSITQECALDELIQYFEKHGLYVMPVKGICAKKRYSDSILRTMGDLDILCKPDQSKAIQLAMQSLGYENHVEGRKHDSYSIPPYVSVEVHRDLVDGDNEFYDYYRNVWERCKQRAGYNCVYEMSLEDEYIFNLVHLVEHFKNGGIGLRFLVDVYVYEHLDMDRGYISAELAKLDLIRFYHNVRSLTLYWFGTDEEKSYIEFTPVLQELGDYILSCGIFGSRENLADLKAVRGKIGSFLRICFPGYDSMKSMFPWLNPLLLPYAWGLRAVRVLKYRRKNLKIVWDSSMSGDAESGKKLMKFYESCGLKF